MRRIDSRTVEFTDEEWLILEVRDRLLDRGYGICEVTQMLTGADIPTIVSPGGVNPTETPHLDAILTDEFLAYINE